MVNVLKILAIRPALHLSNCFTKTDGSQSEALSVWWCVRKKNPASISFLKHYTLKHLPRYIAPSRKLIDERRKSVQHKRSYCQINPRWRVTDVSVYRLKRVSMGQPSNGLIINHRQRSREAVRVGHIDHVRVPYSLLSINTSLMASSRKWNPILITQIS